MRDTPEYHEGAKPETNAFNEQQTSLLCGGAVA
jgi:hypothetical protein